MLERAKEKLKLEMEQNKTNGYVQFIGQALLDYLRDIPGAAEAILSEGKTIRKCVDTIHDEAKSKPTVNNISMLTPQDAINLALRYFDINSNY